MAIGQQQLELEDPFLHNHNPSELRSASEFLTIWVPFLSRDLCTHCTQLLTARILALHPEEELNESNVNKDDAFDANSLGSCKHEGKTNLLGGLKDGVHEVGVSEASYCKPSSRLNSTKTLEQYRMSLAEEDDEWEKETKLVDASARKLTILKAIEKPKPKPIEIIKAKREICGFSQYEDESTGEAWERYKVLLRKYPHHGLSYLIIMLLDTIAENDWNWSKPRRNPTKGGKLELDAPSAMQPQLTTIATPQH